VPSGEHIGSDEAQAIEATWRVAVDGADAGAGD
jgi:hypothetical protein